MALIDSYDVYALTGTGSARDPFTTDASDPVLTSQVMTDTNITGNTAVEGDTPFDSFAMSYPDVSQALPTMLYKGYISVSTGAHQVLAAVGETQDGAYYMFVVADTPAADVQSQTYAFTKNRFGSKPTEWDINRERPFCFLAGTHLRTPEGERAVETVRAGELVLTADGTAKPIRWIGTTITARLFADPIRMMPIRIKAGALADNVPSRDLLVSPGHAIMVEGLLVHASALVNGASIVRETDMPLLFGYYHVELDSHELLVAENTPAESFLEAVSDMRLDNFPERAALTGLGASIEMELPRVKAARQLPASIRVALDGRAGLPGAEWKIAG